MKYFFIFVLLSITCSICYSSTLQEIKKIDEQMYQGTIKYLDTYNSSKGTIEKDVLISYSSNGKFKKRYMLNGKEVDEYYDGKSLITYSDTHTQYERFRENDKETRIFGTVTNQPSWCYGRGLSGLTNIKFDEKTNMLTGDWQDGTKIKAKLEPSLGYAASRIERYFKGGKYSLLSNTNPVLVDGKYYIFKDSSLSFKGRVISEIKILSSTFKEPSESEYTFNKHKQEKIVDLREGNALVVYDKGEIPKNASSYDLLKETKKRADEIIKEKNNALKEKKAEDQKKQISVILSIMVLLIVVIVFVKALIKAKDKKKNYE